MGSVAERPVAGPAAAAQGDRFVPGRQAKFPVGMIGDPEPQAAELVTGGHFDHQRPVPPAADRQGVRGQLPSRGRAGFPGSIAGQGSCRPPACP